MRRRWTSWLSPCPRSLLTGSQNAVRVLVRAGQTGLWKCLRSYRTLPYSSGLPSRSLTFQFLRVGVDGAVMEAFEVSPKDRFQQPFVKQIPLTFCFHVVEVFKVSSQDRVQRLRPLLRTFVLVPRMSRFEGFSHCSP